MMESWGTLGLRFNVDFEFYDSIPTLKVSFLVILETFL